MVLKCIGARLLSRVAGVYFIPPCHQEKRDKLQEVAAEGLKAIVKLVNKSYRWHMCGNLHLGTALSVHSCTLNLKPVLPLSTDGAVFFRPP